MKARENPFRTECVLRVRYRPQGTDWDGLMARLREMALRAAIVGPDGSGKTTLLEDLAPRLEADGFHCRTLSLRPEEPRFEPGFLAEFLPGLAAQDAILFDGADVMGRLAWRRFRRLSRAAGALVVTSHRAGLLPTLIETTTSPELLAAIVGEILRAQPEVAPIPAASLAALARELHAAHGGDLRLALRELYDRYGRGEADPDTRPG